MNLFEINREILDCIDAETGELLDIEKFDMLQLTMQEKVENLGLWVKNLEADKEALKAEENAFKERRQSVERQIENKKKYLSAILNGSPFETARLKISFRKSEVLEIAPEAVIPEEWLKYKEPDVDKAGLKKAIKSGEVEIDGVSILQRQNIGIK